MQAYLDLLRDILVRGRWKQQRAVLDSTKAKPRALSLFGAQMRIDLTRGFPLVTTKRVNFKLVVEELLWFLTGSTDNRDLQARGCGIWDEWADPATGDLGPIYGAQWRRWRTADGKTWDQIAWLVDRLRDVKADPEHWSARRLILTAWNPPEMPLTKGPSACHTLAQFDVTEGRLSCILHQRSADFFLGVPFNIASYALLIHLLAKVVGLGVGEFVHSFGDAHVYENHLDAVRYQLTRIPHAPPRLVLDDAITSIDGIRGEQISLEGYRCSPTIKGEVAV